MMCRTRRRLLGSAGAALLIGGAGAGPALAMAPADLTTLSLEDLMSIEVTVTSAAKRPQRLGDTAAAMFVLTGDEVRRSGVTTIPDALRLVPGVQVARIDANKWAVTARGFNGRFANKLLVLIDGRTAYSPMFSGVFWENQGVFLEDVDRIEVIRGPGASLWGANAVNGVINIITKPAAKTQGAFLTGAVGTEDKGYGGARYGGKIGDLGHFRMYGELSARDAGGLADNRSANDGSQQGRAGFRADLKFTAKDTVTLQGDVFKGRGSETTQSPLFTPPYSLSVNQGERRENANILGRWTHQFSDTSNLTAQVYFQQGSSHGYLGSLKDHMIDGQVEHRFQIGDRHDIVWGVGARLYHSLLGGSTMLGGNYPERTDTMLNTFVQDEITLIPSTLKLTLGSKFERNDYSGFEVQPSARITWSPHPDHMVWAAVSRAVRTPSRSEQDVMAFPQVIPGPGGLPIAINYQGNRGFQSEKLVAYELGYRVQPMRTLSVDVAAFYNVYSDLRSFRTGAPAFVFDPVPHLVVPVTAGNDLEGSTYGAEVSAEWEVRNGWRLRGSYSALKMHLREKNGVVDPESASAEGGSPLHQFVLRSSHDITPDLDLDVTLRAVDRLKSLDTPGYVGLDVRLAWRPEDGWELAVVGQNLLGRNHLEFKPDLIDTRPSWVQRGVYAKLSRHF